MISMLNDVGAIDCVKVHLDLDLWTDYCNIERGRRL